MKVIEKEGLKSFEIPSPNVSEEYVFIPSSKIVDILEPEFKFKKCNLYTGTNHTLFFEKDGINIAIENSYDKSHALRFRLYDYYFYIPLNFQKRIHRGKYAQNFIEDLKKNKENIIEAVQDAKNVVEKLKTTTISDEFKKKIEEVVFGHLTKKGYKIRYNSKHNIFLNNNSTFYYYISWIITEYVEGNYIILKPNGKMRKGREIRNNFSILKLQQKIYKIIKENHPEVLI